MSGSYHSGKTRLSYGEGADEEASRTMFGESKPLKFSFLSGSNATCSAYLSHFLTLWPNPLFPASLTGSFYNIVSSPPLLIRMCHSNSRSYVPFSSSSNGFALQQLCFRGRKYSSQIQIQV